VRIDEFGFRMLAEDVVLFFDQGFPRCKLISITAAGVRFQFKPAFVLVVDRIPELFRICRMYQHRYSQLTALGPYGIYARVVYRNPVSFTVLVPDA
jgi:hypothetical protein